jgi:hypothetical protein
MAPTDPRGNFPPRVPIQVDDPVNIVDALLLEKERTWTWLGRKVGVSKQLANFWRNRQRRICDQYKPLISIALDVPITLIWRTINE